MHSNSLATLRRLHPKKRSAGVTPLRPRPHEDGGPGPPIVETDLAVQDPLGPIAPSISR